MAAKSIQPRVAGKPFDVEAYWRGMGGYLATEGISPEHIAVEARLGELLQTLDPVDVLDVGCGRGRLARLLKEWLPGTAYYGVDLGDAQVEATGHARPDGTIYQSRLQDFRPEQQWDLVLCSEVLMHVPPQDIEAVAETLNRATRHAMVLIEWVPEPWELSEPIAPWNWPHDYEALFGPFIVKERIYRQDLMLALR